MRKILLSLFFLTTILNAAIDVSVPRAVMSGEVNEYKIHTKGSVRIKALPKVKHLRWGNPSSFKFTSIQNGRVRTEQGVSVAFAYDGKGKFIIPAFDILVDDKTVTLAAKEIRVSNNPLEEKTDVEISFPGRASAPRSVVVGQEIPVEFKFFIDENLKTELDFPKVTPSEVGVLKEFNYAGVSNRDESYHKNFRKIGPRGSYTLEKERRNGGRYLVFTVETALVAQRKGALLAEVTLPIEVSDGRDFFNRRTKRYTLKAETPIIQVTDLPQLEEEGYNLDLIGDWQFSSSLSKEEVKLGYPFSFKLKIKGQGDINRIRIPSAQEFKIEGFDIQKIDFSKTTKGAAWEAELNFIISANSSKSEFPELSFASFDISKMKYNIYRAVHDLKISVPKQNDAQAVRNRAREYTVPEKTEAKVEEEPLKQEEISHISSNELKVKKTLWKNIHPAYFLIVPVAPLIFILSLLLTVPRPDEVLRSRAQKAAFKKAIKEIKKLKSLSADDLSRELNESCLPSVGEALGLGRSATSEEIAKSLGDADLTKLLRESSHSSYLPGARSATVKATDLSASLMKAFKSSFILLLCLLPMQQTWAEASATELYEADKFNKALVAYEQEMTLGELDPYLIYNAGNAAFKSAQFPKALAYYEQAARLLPRDERIAFNLKLCRQKMTLNDSSLSFIDTLRPDEYLQLSLVLWGVFFLALIILRQKRWLKPGLVAVLLAITLMPLAISFWQSQSSYAEGQALSLSKTELYSSPSEDKKLEKSLEAGQSFLVEEELTEKGFTRIKIAGSEFWLKSAEVLKYW